MKFVKVTKLSYLERLDNLLIRILRLFGVKRYNLHAVPYLKVEEEE